jgi:hypothetical protein
LKYGRVQGVAQRRFMSTEFMLVIAPPYDVSPGNVAAMPSDSPSGGGSTNYRFTKERGLVPFSAIIAGWHSPLAPV